MDRTQVYVNHSPCLGTGGLPSLSIRHIIKGQAGHGQAKQPPSKVGQWISRGSAFCPSQSLNWSCPTKVGGQVSLLVELAYGKSAHPVVLRWAVRREVSVGKSWLHHLPAVLPWASQPDTLYLDFLISKVEPIIPDLEEKCVCANIVKYTQCHNSEGVKMLCYQATWAWTSSPSCKLCDLGKVVEPLWASFVSSVQ